jgi:hypothetical protein
VSKLVQHLKRTTPRKLMSEYRRIAKQFWRRHSGFEAIPPQAAAT